jgi:hypothetical protein
VNKFFGLILTMVLAFSALNAEAARRLGGGKSSGQQSNNVTQREAVKPAAPAAPAVPSQAAAPAKPTAPAAAPAAPAKRPWGAMLGGLAAGLGLAWLAHSLGMGEAFGNMLMSLAISCARAKAVLPNSRVTWPIKVLAKQPNRLQHCANTTLKKSATTLQRGLGKHKTHALIQRLMPMPTALPMRVAP